MFDDKACETLGFYVYGLFDSHSARIPFYIGKGTGNRIFSHAKGELITKVDTDFLSPKLHKINEIKKNGGAVVHKILRFGLSEEQSLDLESTLIDIVNFIAPESLKNEISGHGVAEGFYDAIDLALALSAPKFESEQPVLLIKIERRWTELVTKYGSSSAIPLNEIYLATKGSWRLNPARAKRADCVLAVARGLVRAVFVPTEWVDATEPGRKDMADQSDSTLHSAFVGTSVAHLFSKGSQNPIRYFKC